MKFFKVKPRMKRPISLPYKENEIGLFENWLCVIRNADFPYPHFVHLRRARMGKQPFPIFRGFEAFVPNIVRVAFQRFKTDYAAEFVNLFINFFAVKPQE